MKRHNPEKRAWKGRSYRKGGERVRDLREKVGCHHPRLRHSILLKHHSSPIECASCGADVPLDEVLRRWDS